VAQVYEIHLDDLYRVSFYLVVVSRTDKEEGGADYASHAAILNEVKQGPKPAEKLIEKQFRHQAPGLRRGEEFSETFLDLRWFLCIRVVLTDMLLNLAVVVKAVAGNPIPVLPSSSCQIIFSEPLIGLAVFRPQDTVGAHLHVKVRGPLEFSRMTLKSHQLSFTVPLRLDFTVLVGYVNV
jgi:hypothetical protein